LHDCSNAYSNATSTASRPDNFSGVTDLAEFLLERIRDDEDANVDQLVASIQRESLHFGRWDPPRVMKECKVKRWIVEMHQQAPTASTWEVLRLLGTLYAGHPDYREEWVP
jgi:hypothetical protein